MTETETVLLCRLVKGLCPAQAIDRFTPAAWYSVLGKYDFEAACGVVRKLAEDLRFIAVADIVLELKRVREAELSAQRDLHLFDEIRAHDREVQAGQRGKPPAQLADTLTELRARLTGGQQ